MDWLKVNIRVPGGGNSPKTNRWNPVQPNVDVTLFRSSCQLLTNRNMLLGFTKKLGREEQKTFFLEVVKI